MPKTPLPLIAAGLWLSGAAAWAAPAPPAAPAGEAVDKFGGWLDVAGTPGESFHLERIGSRWWLVTPEGHGIFIRAVSKVDTADYGGSGGFQAYDGVYLETAGALSPDLHAAAEDSRPGDVVHPASGFTLKSVGDAIYLGSSRFKPNYTYFWLHQLGRGGRLEWLYSTESGWKPIGGDGRPQEVRVPGPGGSWSLDAGNYMGPGEDGFGRWEHPAANRVTWWDMAQGFPDDFAAVRFAGDAAPRWYLKGVVREGFSVPAVLNQCYERAELAEVIAKKYGPGDHDARWAEAVTERLRSWGFNAAGQYSYRYVEKAPGLGDRLPVEPTWALGGWVTRKDRPYHAKNVYAGAVFPPGSRELLYQGLQPDAFDPAFERGYVEMVRREARERSATGPWSWALIPEEADYLFGLNSLTHDHLGYVALSQNPFHPRASIDGKEIAYDDPRLYAKYALRDLLRDRYRAAGDDLPAFQPGTAVPAYGYARRPAGPELAALENLNAAWGTGYTTWDTSSGDLARGDNAWGTGSGFMDEDGKGILAPGCRSVGFEKAFTDPAHPPLRKDLDDFVKCFAWRYGRVLSKAFAQVPHPVLLLPIYNGPGFVYEALAPYADGFWVSVPDAKDALRIYDAGRKPLVVADYLTADPDSPCHFKAPIASVRFDAARGTTAITAPRLRYVFRMAKAITFPDAPELLESYRRVGKPYPCPRVTSAWWDIVEVPGDYTGHLRPGMHIETWKHGKYPYPRRTQEERARDMIRHYEALLSLRGDDGLGFVIGIEHWCLYDPAPSNWCDDENFGLATFLDDAYDGIEARRAVGTDSRGRPIGGEDGDYGDLLGTLGGFLRTIRRRSPRRRARGEGARGAGRRAPGLSGHRPAITWPPAAASPAARCPPRRPARRARGALPRGGTSLPSRPSRSSCSPTRPCSRPRGGPARARPASRRRRGLRRPCPARPAPGPAAAPAPRRRPGLRPAGSWPRRWLRRPAPCGRSRARG
ncbi:MAG: hypothetical protein HY721_22820 [Planctomycetes bacterium]|nr:hypothetical protein [Planctomycetota bacterium]